VSEGRSLFFDCGGLYFVALLMIISQYTTGAAFIKVKEGLKQLKADA
jgi:hypothetical protein